MPADLSDPEQRLEVFDWIADLGAELHIVVNNVGGNAPKSTLAYAEDEVRAVERVRLPAEGQVDRGRRVARDLVERCCVGGLVGARVSTPASGSLDGARLLTVSVFDCGS